MSVNFTENFEIEKTEDWYDYNVFIDTLRLQARDGNHFTRHRVPVLPEQPLRGAKPTRFFDVVLSTNTNSLTLRFQQENLYLVAYQDESEQWNEFDDRWYPMVPGSKSLRFKGSYDELTRLAKDRRASIPLGRDLLIKAVNILATNPPSHQQKALSLIVIIQMISESMRFREILRKICVKYLEPFQPRQRFELLENAWSPLSLALLWDDRYPGTKLHLSEGDSENLEIRTIGQVVKAVGMVLYRTVPPNNG